MDVVHNDGKDGNKSSRVHPPAYSFDPDDNYIRFGSTIFLRHFNTGGFLRMTDLRYKKSLGQSDQHIIYNVHSREPSLDDKWEVFAPKDGTEFKGPHKQNLPYGSRIRLFSEANNRWLHSHKYKAPVTTDHREVTGYGNINSTNDDDVWIIEKAEDGTDFWRTNDVFLLRHESSDRFLHSHATLFSGEKEVSACSERNSINNLWRAQLQ
ncbi:Protein O-mannosyl-transferase 2 [Mortierella sp. AD094]|nr:Protein O-mannosyl-transferase 2 [Mortierella sp. AD094]